MRNPLSPEQITALRQLGELFPSTRVVLLGASALGFHVEMSWRGTKDLDVSVSIGAKDLSRIGSLAGWEPHPNIEHRWEALDSVTVDVIPADEESLRTGALIWPRSGKRMSLRGFRAAFRTARNIDIGNVVVGLPPASVIVLLKMIAYNERPGEREKDLGDIAYTMDRHVPDDDPRRFGEDIRNLDLDYDEAGAFLLGRELADVDPDEHSEILAFLKRVGNEKDPHGTGVRLARLAPATWGDELRHKEDALRIRVRALLLGLGADARPWAPR